MEGITNCRILAVCPADGDQGNLGIIEHAAILWDEDTIEWVGSADALPADRRSLPLVDARNTLALPGLVDCHTHLAFGGWREDEFCERIMGITYEAIAGRGGGIVRTVQKTRVASSEELQERCKRFLGEMARLGVTTVECKSGYGLDLETELKVLRLYRDLAAAGPLTLIPTFLGCHTIPPEFVNRRQEYLAFVCDIVLPEVARNRLASFCDIFIDESAFSIEEAEAVLRRASDLGMALRVHADQFTSAGGAALAARMEAASADHLENASDDDLDVLAQAGVPAVVLPLCALYTMRPPLDARRLIEKGIKVAVATDFNPGSAPSYHLPLAMMLACTMNRLTPSEALKGATIVAARTLQCESERGSLEVGKKADIILIDAESVDHWLYHFAGNACVMTIKNGKRIYQDERF